MLGSMSALPMALVGILGLIIGSFLNVVIHRVPLGISLLIPATSACPSCGHSIRPYDNLPVLSWLLLRGRCRDCAAWIALRYPMVELATSVLFMSFAARVGWEPFLGAALTVAAAGVALVFIDLDHRRLPFALTRVSGVLVAAFLVIDVAVEGAEPVPRALSSAALWLLVYGGVWLLTRGRGMGLGDVALAPLLGLVLGWWGWGSSLVALIGGFVLGALLGIGLLIAGRARRRSKIPHGPSMLAGAGLAFFAGEELWAAYLALFGLR